MSKMQLLSKNERVSETSVWKGRVNMTGRDIQEFLVLLAMFYLIIWNTGIHLLFLVFSMSEVFHKMFEKSKDEMNRVELRSKFNTKKITKRIHMG